MDSNNPVSRFEKFQRQQEKIINFQNEYQDSIFKSEGNFSLSKNIKNLDKELLISSDISNLKNKTKLIEEDSKSKERNKLFFSQKISSKEEELLNEMKTQSKLYNSKIMESLNLKEKEDIVNLNNFEENIVELGLELTDIDPKLKKLSKLKIGKDLLLKKIKNKLKESSELDFFKDNKFGGRIKTQNTNDFVGRFKPAMSMEMKLMIEEQNKKKKLLNPLEKRYDYEDQRSMTHLISIREQKRKIHEIQIRKMHTENQATTIKSNLYSTKNLPNFTLMLNNSKEKESLRDKQKNLEKKIKNRKKNKIVLGNLSNYIVDLVEEIFIYQSEKNDTKIYLDDWRNWCSMFIKNDPFSRAQKINMDYFDINESINEDNKQSNFSISENSDSEEEDLKDKDTTFEECELMDYLYFRGIYSSSVVNEKNLNIILDFFDIMGKNYIPKSQENNKVKSRNKYKEYEPKEDDIKNLTIPKEIPRNNLFTEIVEILFDLKFIEENKDNKGIIFS